MLGRDPDFNESALVLLRDGCPDEALALLRNAIEDMPPGWTPIQSENGNEVVYCWDEDEFVEYCRYQGTESSGGPTILWKLGSYSQACWIAGSIYIDRREFPEALHILDLGLQLEPNHPELLCEKAFVHQTQNQHKQALELFRQAEQSRAWATDAQKTRAWRGQGVCLVDLNRLEEAEQVLKQALQVDPEDTGAAGELEFIRGLRERRSQSSGPHWPFDQGLDPPSDALTRRLTEMVKDLPAIPGPQTVGPDNFTRIQEAFLACGWDGFEEEFSKLYPPDDPQHEGIKARLLREPCFRPKTYENMTKLMRAYQEGGEKGLHNAFEAMFRDKAPRKPS